MNGLNHRNILRLLRFGVPPSVAATRVFYDAICNEYDLICADYGCEPEISPPALFSAWRQWDSDLDNIQIAASGNTRAEPDHYKQAAWLCHWLRKKQPIYKLNIVDPSKLIKEFEERYNEYCALRTALKILLIYEVQNVPNTELNRISSVHYAPLYADFTQFLSHKAVSPHAIYMMFRALFFKTP